MFIIGWPHLFGVLKPDRTMYEKLLHIIIQNTKAKHTGCPCFGSLDGDRANVNWGQVADFSAFTGSEKESHTDSCSF